MPTIAISAVNIVEGGMLKILQDCLLTVKKVLPEWRVVVLVNNADVINVENIEVITLPSAKKAWLRRIWCEYVTMFGISKEINADIWWSLHDMTPRVIAKSQFVYCHTPGPLHKFSFKELFLEPKLIMFKALYCYFYKINIYANRAVIVQQTWVKREFERRFGVRNIVIAHPVEAVTQPARIGERRISTFVYPALARVFKNFELIGEAARLLEAEPDWQGRIVLTIDPNENRLTRMLFRQYGALKSIDFVGRQDRAAMTRLYDNMDCLLFPSRLETWGLPITETKALGKPMIVADLPYAHETTGTYDRVRFVDPGNARQLADIMLAAHREGWESEPVIAPPVEPPFIDNWPHLVEMVVAMHHDGLHCGHGANHIGAG